MTSEAPSKNGIRPISIPGILAVSQTASALLKCDLVEAVTGCDAVGHHCPVDPNPAAAPAGIATYGEQCAGYRCRGRKWSARGINARYSHPPHGLELGFRGITQEHRPIKAGRLGWGGHAADLDLTRKPVTQGNAACTVGRAAVRSCEKNIRDLLFCET